MDYQTIDYQLEFAEQQLLGYAHGRAGYSVITLATDMGLTAFEWSKLRAGVFLSENDMQELDEFFSDGE